MISDERTEYFESKPILSWLRHWDSALLLALVVGIVALCIYLMWPQPKAVIALQTSSDTGGPAMELAAAAPVMEEGAPDTKISAKTRHHKRTPKKPAKPPVLNLNTATGAQFQLLPGIGPKMAQRILEYRKVHGPFQTTGQIMDVKGIGPKTFEKLKPFLKL